MSSIAKLHSNLTIQYIHAIVLIHLREFFMYDRNGRSMRLLHPVFCLVCAGIAAMIPGAHWFVAVFLLLAGGCIWAYWPDVRSITLQATRWFGREFGGIW